jgi:hypothetical protein
MKLYIEKNKMTDNPSGFLRQMGYGFLPARGSGEDSYVRRFYGSEFPRLHMYVNDRGDKWEFHLHLDQKPVSYKGSKAHSGEYEGEMVEEEIARLRRGLGIGDLLSREAATDRRKPSGQASNKQRITNGGNNSRQNLSADQGKSRSAEERLGEGKLDDIAAPDQKKSIWQLIKDIIIKKQ